MMAVVFVILRVFFSVLFRLKRSGWEKLDFSKPTIIMPNHVSLLDAVFLALFLPKEVTFVVNTGIAKKFGALIRLRKHITVDPLNPYSVRTMVKTVQSGVPLLLFPEGRITTNGGLMKVYPGIGYIAMKTGASLYPVAIEGLERSKLSYLQGKLRTSLFPAVSIAIGDPFVIEQPRHLPVRRQKELAADRIQRELQEHLFRSRMKAGINLYNEVLAAAGRHGFSFAVCEDLTQKLTYRKLLLAANALSRRLARLLESERTAAVLLPNAIAHVVTLLALLRIGKSPAILNFSAGKQALLDACETASVRTILTSRLFIEKAKLEPVIAELGSRFRIVYLEDVRETVSAADKLFALMEVTLRKQAPAASSPSQSNDPSIILFTSGSESKPKGVCLSQDNVFANVQQARSVIDFTQRDIVFNAMPLFHSFGLTAGTMLPLLTGMKVILYPSPLHYKVIPELVYDRSATILFGTSTFLAAYGRTAHPFDFYSLRYVVAGAEKLKDEVRQLWADKFGIRILEGYGTTEAAPVLTLNTPLHCRKGTVGKLLPGIRCKLETIPGIDAGGNLLVQGPNLMRGYLIHGQGFVPCPEWYDCGDVVDIDGDSYVTIKSRLKRFAKIGGEMVSLNAVEEACAACYGDSGVAAVNVPDSRKGEKVVVFHTKTGYQLAPLKDYLRTQGLTPLMLPAKLIYIEKLPLLGSGKTDYVTLKQLALKEGVEV